MLKKISSFLLFFLLLSSSFNLISISPARAAGASLFLSPAAGEYVVGKTFTVKVMVNSGGGVGINAAEGTINFDPALLLVSKATKDGSIFSLWTAEPTFSNKNGTVSFGGGSPSAFSGSSGMIMSVVFVARKEGVANVTFSSGLVLAADGKGTNVYSGSGAGAYTIKAAAEEKPVEEKKPEEKKPEEQPTNPKAPVPSAPDLSSATHPDENKWYAKNLVTMSWHLLAELTGVSITLDDKPTADPGASSIGLVDTKDFENVPDGTYYVHAKFKNQYGWGQLANRKVMIDVTAPVEFEVMIDNGGDNTNPKPIIDFTTTDAISGVDHYALTLDGKSEDVPSRNFKTDPYIPQLLGPGDHQVMAVAIDKAGNRSTSTKRFSIEALKMPVITEMPKMINTGESFNVRGTSFYPESTITLFFAKDGKEFEQAKVSTDGEGNWSYFRKKGFDKGNYEIWTKVTDKRGAESNITERQPFSVVSPSLIQAYGWWVVFFLLMVITGLVLYIFYQRKKLIEMRTRLQSEVEEVRSKMGEVFNALKEEVDELMEFADKKPGLSESEKRVKEKLKEALDISEEFINKEVTDVEKEIK